MATNYKESLSLALRKWGHAQGPAAESISEGIDQERFSETAIAHGQQPRSAERTFVGYRS